MAAIKVKPGRARVSMKIRTSETSIDSSAGYMPEAVALTLWRTALTGDYPWRAELEAFRGALRGDHRDGVSTLAESREALLSAILKECASC